MIHTYYSFVQSKDFRKSSICFVLWCFPPALTSALGRPRKNSIAKYLKAF